MTGQQEEDQEQEYPGTQGALELMAAGLLIVNFISSPSKVQALQRSIEDLGKIARTAMGYGR